jgi:uncharacterized protein with beta-barrel porin domain
MKIPNFNRRRLLRAIHAACVALFLMASQHAARAQTATGDGRGDITISGSGSNAFNFSTSSTPPLAAGGTLTIAGGANLNSASGFYEIQSYSPVTVVNNGNVSMTNSGNSTANGLYFAPLASGNVAITNSATGTISGTSNTNSYARGVWDYYQSGSGNFALTNSGVISALSAGNLALGVVAHVGSGSTILTNNAGATISATSTNSNYGDAVYLTADTGPVTISNSGSISGTGGSDPGIGIQVSSGSGNVSITNSGGIDGVLQTAMDTGAVYSVQIREGAGAGTVSLTNNGGTLYAVGTTASSAYGADITSSASGGIKVTGGGIIAAETQGSFADGIRIDNSGTGASTIDFGGYVEATADGAANGFDVLSTGGGAVSVTTFGISSIMTVQSTNSHAYGINVQSNGMAVVTNAEATINAIAVGSGDGVGINLSSSAGSASISNTGVIMATSGTSGSAYGIRYQTSGSGAAQISNAGGIDVSAGQDAMGISAASGNLDPVTIDNSEGISATTPHGDSFGIHVDFGGSVVVNNSASITAATDTGYAAAVWVDGSGSVDLTNNGTLTSTTTTSGLSVAVVANAGAVTINNRGQIVAASTNNSGSGIYSITGSGSFRLTNSGSISGSAGAPTGSGVTVLGGGTVANTGTISADYIGVELRAPSTVTNSGSGVISGGVAAIVVPSGSTVNLEGKSQVNGLIYGGQDITSTSVLNFDLSVPTAQLRADKTALNAAIAAYDAALAGADPNSSAESSVVTINGVDYQWENFGGVTDHLRSARRYGAFAGYLGLGSAIDNFNAGDARGASLVAALGALPDSAVPSALAQLSPQALQVLRNIAFDGAGFTAANVNDHLGNLRAGLSGFDMSGFTVNAPGVDPTLTDVRSHLLAWNPAPESADLLSDSPAPWFAGVDAKDMKSAVNTQPVDRWSSFISGSVILADLDNTFSNAGDASYTTGSVMAGCDYRIDERVTVGVLFDYSHTGADLDGNSSKATVDSYAPGVYGSYVDGPWYANGLVSYGFNRTTEDRAVSVPGLAGDDRASAEGGQVMSALTGGYEIQRGHFKFGPVASLQYVHLRVDAFHEDGSTSLAIGGQDDDSLRTQLGLEARYTTALQTPLGRMTFTPHLRASWQHECMDNNDGITASFNGTGGGSFVVQGVQPERDSAFLDLGIDAGVAQNVTLFVDYQSQAGQDHFFAQSAQGGVRVGF